MWIIVAAIGGIVLGIVIHYVWMQSFKIGYLRVDSLEFENYHSPDFYMEVHDPEFIGELREGQCVLLEVKTDSMKL